MPYRQNFPIPAVIDPPRCCLVIEIPDHPDWKKVISGLLFELSYWFNWERTGDTSGAQCAAVWKTVYNSIDWNLMACGNGGNCCTPPAITIRISPTTGLPEQSTDGGVTWTPAAGGLQSVIVEPIPPVTSGVAGTKCDAATNLAGQVDVWIAQVETDFDTAVSLLEFAVGVLEAILLAVVTILSLGTLTAIEAAVLPLLGAALFAVWGAGKAAFSAYWTTDIKDQILCAAYCNIGDDGSFTDISFSTFWNQLNTDLPVGPAKMLFMGFLSSVGRQGVNAMAATGMSADADCADCDCGDPCAIDNWTAGWWNAGVYTDPPFWGGTIVDSGVDYVTIQSGDRGDGQQVINLTTENGLICCGFTAEYIGSTPASTLHFFNYCGEHANYATQIADDTAPFSAAFTQCFLQMSPGGPWTIKFTIIP